MSFRTDVRLSLALLALSFASLSFSFETLPPKLQARESLRFYLEAGWDVDQPEVRLAKIRKLLARYRTGPEAVVTAQDAPYPKFVMKSQFGSIYVGQYDRALKDALEHPPLDSIFDEFMSMIVENRLPESMRSAGKQIGRRMAKRALKGKGPGCVLDLSPRIDEPSTAMLLKLKLDLLNGIPSCMYRKNLFNAAKKQLLAAIKSPDTGKVIREQVTKAFPPVFQQKFFAEIGARLAGFPALVARKFGGAAASPGAFPMVEAVEDMPIAGGRQTIRLASFANGLKTDLLASKALLASQAPEDRALAGLLFYSVVNRVLFIGGGEGAAFDARASRLAVDGTETYEKRTIPKLRGEPFGGWGFEKKGPATYVPSAWDWTGYDPDAEANPTPYRVLPTKFTIDARGVPGWTSEKDLVQDNEDLGALFEALATFIRETKPDGVFGAYFGSADRMADLLDEKKPMLFPSEGRLLAIAVFAGMAQNLLHAQYGHIVMTDDAEHVHFRDHSTYGSIDAKDVSTVGVARLLRAAGMLLEALHDDPILKLKEGEKIQEYLPQLDILLQQGVIVVGANAQLPTGEFRAQLYDQDSAVDERASVQTMLAMLKAYDTTEVLLLQARLYPGFKSLMADPALRSPGQFGALNLDVIRLWDEAQRYYRANQPDLPWAEWDVTIADLKASLRGSLGL